MADIKHIIYSKLGIASDRTRNIAKHVLLSGLFKGGGIIANFLVVPITIDYLDTDNYGVWLTISSFIAWFSFFDIGLGNGLRNKFAEARAKGDIGLAKSYVSTAYFSISFIMLALGLIFISLNFLVDWTIVFNTPHSLSKELSLLMPILLGFFCLQLVLKLIITLYTADQHHSMQGKFNFFVQLFSLVLVWLLTKTTGTSLFLFTTVYSALPVLLLIVLSIVGFRGRYHAFKPEWSKFKREHLSAIFGLGFKFFIIQISGIIIFSTDSILIANVMSPREVVPYQLAYKVFSISTMVFSIITTPYWSSFTDAFVKGDISWMTTAMRVLNRYAYCFVLLCGLLLLASPLIYSVWLQNKVTIPFELSCFMCVYFAITLLSTPYTIFINGTGKVALQSWQAILSAVFNIPLCLLFSVYFDMGTAGIVLGTIICLLPTLFFAPLQTQLILRNKATGIFNK